MKTIIANQTIYDHFRMGVAEAPEALMDGGFMISFHDEDNDEVHVFKVSEQALGQYIELLNQAKSGVKLHIAGAHEMPKEKPHG